MAKSFATQIQDSALWKQHFTLIAESSVGLEERSAPEDERFVGVKE
jgi:hypothetical protein